MSYRTDTHHNNSRLVTDPLKVRDHLCLVLKKGGPIKCTAHSDPGQCTNGTIDGDKKGLYPVDSSLTHCVAEDIQSGTHIPVDGAFGGALASGKPLYACVNQDIVYSGLATNNLVSAIHMQETCGLNGGTVQQISLSLH